MTEKRTDEPQQRRPRADPAPPPQRRLRAQAPVDVMGRRKFGDQRACSKCGHDVEWHGRAVGWMDRGQGTDCLPTGKYDEDGYRIPAPAGRHMVHER